jgi:hypothetical protein
VDLDDLVASFARSPEALHSVSALVEVAIADHSEPSLAEHFRGVPSHLANLDMLATDAQVLLGIASNHLTSALGLRWSAIVFRLGAFLL